MTSTSEERETRAGATRRWSRRLVVVLAAVLVGGGGVLAGQASGGHGTPAADGAEVPTATATVTRRTLADRIKVDGVLGYAGKTQLANHAGGVLTSVAGVGDTVQRGGVLYRLDDRPVVLLEGRLPQWREFRQGMTRGRDVRQLERNLRALGFDPDHEMVVDDRFSSTTAAAIERWQKSLGTSPTGVVRMGDLVFHPRPVRVAQRLASVGARVAPGAPVLAVTGHRRLVTVRLDVSRRALVKAGTKVRVVLPSGRTVPGAVTAVGRVATERGDDVTVDVTVRLRDKDAAGALDHAPVEVLVSLRSTTALAVPVKALLALPTGGFAVETLSEGRRQRVPVTTGMFADGYVEVAGQGIDEGMRVVVPR